MAAELPPHAAAAVRRILDAAARRILAEQLAAWREDEAPDSTARDGRITR